MGNPIDDYLEITSQKTAGLSQAVRGYRRAFGAEQLGGLAGSATMVAGVSILAEAARRAYMAATKSLDHKLMLEVNPDLVENQSADPKMFSQHYNSLRRMNPHFAQDPVVAGAYMRRMSEFPHNAGSILVESLKEAPKSEALRNFSAGLGIAQQAAAPSPMEQARLEEQQMKLHRAKSESQDDAGY